MNDQLPDGAGPTEEPSLDVKAAVPATDVAVARADVAAGVSAAAPEVPAGEWVKPDVIDSNGSVHARTFNTPSGHTVTVLFAPEFLRGNVVIDGVQCTPQLPTEYVRFEIVVLDGREVHVGGKFSAFPKDGRHNGWNETVLEREVERFIAGGHLTDSPSGNHFYYVAY